MVLICAKQQSIAKIALFWLIIHVHLASKVECSDEQSDEQSDDLEEIRGLEASIENYQKITQKEQTKHSNKSKISEENKAKLDEMNVIIDLFRIKYKCLLSFFNVFFSQIR